MNTLLDTLTVIMPITRPEDEFDDVCEAFNVTSLNDKLIAKSSLSSEQDELFCSMCDETYDSPPRILKCLHVFCENCLNKTIEKGTNICDGQKDIICAICKEVTKIKAQDVSSLPYDYVLMNSIEMNAVKTSSVLCTSCKSEENAVARCADCPHFLCPNCNSAHQSMICFENHHVRSLDEIRESTEKMPLHKPIHCTQHKKKIQFYCITCQETICDECITNEHAAPVHVYEELGSYGVEARSELENLVKEKKQKLEEYARTKAELENTLNELENQHDNAQDLINETFQSYKAILEKLRDTALETLKDVHTRQELKVMDAMQNIERQTDSIEYVCSFTTRVLDKGSDGELLTIKQPITNQLELLSERTISLPKYTMSLEFITNLDQFQSQAKKAFGYVKDPDAVMPPEKPFVESLINGHGSASDLRILDAVSPNIPPQCINPLAISMGNGNTTMSNAVSMQSSPVTSSPLSMPSSFDGDSFTAIAPQSPPLEGLTTLGELNLTRLASLAACNGKPASPPLVSGNNASSTFPLDLLGPSEMPSNLMNNIQALAKLGSVHVPEPVNDMMNGYGSISGLTSPNVMSSFDAGVDASAVLELVNGSSNLMMNGHGSTFDSGPSSFFSSHNGIDSTLMHPMGNGGSSGNNGVGIGIYNGGYHSYSRSNSQRAAALEIHFKFGQLGSSACQFGSPHGFCIADDDSIIVADTNNHRIQVFNKDGEFRHQFGIAGKLEGQLWYPRKIEILPSGNFVICDRGNERSRLQLFSRDGMFIKKIRLKYVDIVAGMTVAEDGDIVIVDSVQPSLYKLDESGTLATWFDCKGVMTEPSDIAVRNSKFYICDFKGHCVCVFSHEGQFLNRIGSQNLTDFPNGIDVLPNGNILVGDSHGNKFHICIFSPDGTLLCEYECPYVKVSRCCGLKITSEGCIITVAKNNHHVLVLKSPF